MPDQLQARSSTNFNKGGQSIKAAARRDPAVFPLAIIMGAVFLGAGYFLTEKGWYNNAPERHYAAVSHPWQVKEDDEEYNRIKDKLSAFKYKYRDQQGNLVEALSASQRELYPVKEAPKKWGKGEIDN